eukprot:SAG11_NODE_16240_length_553_cov_1.224670_1_plen_55_part_10
MMPFIMMVPIDLAIRILQTTLYYCIHVVGTLVLLNLVHICIFFYMHATYSCTADP